MATRLKRSATSDQNQTRFKKVHSQGESRSSKFKVEKGGSSKDGKPTCANCGKKRYGECLLGAGSFFSCDKDGHKMRGCPMIASRGREGLQVAPGGPKDDASTKRHFYALHSRVEKSDEKESDDDVGNFSLFC